MKTKWGFAGLTGAPTGALMCALVLGLGAGGATAQDRMPVQISDYGQWESLGSGTLSQNGEMACGSDLPRQR